MQDLQSPRVNAARLSNFVGRTVRLPCKFVSRHMDGTLVQACDGGEVVIQHKDQEKLSGTCVEVIGRVVNESAIKLLMSINLDSDKELDMKLVNDVVELTFDPRFKKMFPS